MIHILDTDTCIYFLKGRFPSIKAKLSSRRPKDIKISAVVKAELLFGAENSDHVKRNKNRIDAFLLPYEIIPFDSLVAETYATVRRRLEKAGTPIGANDLMIAATVLSTGGVLVTNNTVEFRRVRGLKVENWAK